MAFEDVLDTARNMAGGFFSGTSGDEIGRRRQAQDLLGGIRGAATAEERDPLLQQLSTIAPQTAAAQISNFAELDKQRQKAMFQDAFSVRRQLDRDPAAALDIISSRVAAGQNVGADMADTQEIGDLIASGDIEGAKQELDSFIEFGVSQGFGDGNQDIVKSSQVLPDGSTIQVLRSGKTRFTDPSGNVLTGKERADALKTASTFGIGEQGARSLIREQKKQSQALAKDAFDRLGPIRTSIANLDDVERVINEGAGTGVIQSRLPSVRAASIELDNLRNRMGLDVIGGATFGALSESELEFALDTALPDQLEGPELADWVRRKRDAQGKVLDALTEQAKFFSGGGTIQELLQKQERDKANQAGPDTEVITPEGTNKTGRFQIEVISE